ncbi:methyltransferase domain-containing protein [Massilia glaciei]|uniref:Methyltransferase domain-containing protein n=1 Tax=Massilia glaciei TaxID=1524097 RepID=A0A2U2I4G6_9BURK|nr:methyltransferase domain-containing protein [Massilia glaciei]PWF54700.1 methyltransferase domain-containing protein [Massilia glaciei]
MPDFASRDPKQPGFWDERFERGFTPWDRGGVPNALRRFAVASSPLVTLIPGCGAAYELACLSEAGWDATAIDFSPSAVARGKAAVGPWHQRVLEADFFAYEPPQALELIYERAFLCALPPAMWPRVAARWAQLLAPGGRLAGFFFFDDTQRGPPFGIGAAELDALLAPHFERIEDAPADDSVAVFEGKERWQVWQRRS